MAISKPVSAKLETNPHFFFHRSYIQMSKIDLNMELHKICTNQQNALANPNLNIFAAADIGSSSYIACQKAIFFVIKKKAIFLGQKSRIQ